MAGQSVTSPGAETSIAWVRPGDLARDSVAANRQLKWCDTAQRGYMAIELTPRSATSEWRFLASIREKGTALAGTRRMSVLAGQRRFSA
jgi:alkaline phosphatase D